MITNRPVLTKEIIYKKVSSFDIFAKYCDPFTRIGQSFSSELRKDKDPSCQIDWIRGDLMYSDFGNNTHFRAIGYVMEKYNLKYYHALEKIAREFNLIENEGNYKRNQSQFLCTSGKYGDLLCNNNDQLKDKSPTIIKVRKRVNQDGQYYFRTEDLQYWEEFYWTEWMLRQSKTWAISHFFLNNRKTEFQDKMYTVGSERAFVYDYYRHKDIFRRKIYFPDRKNNKWISNVDNSIVQLVDVMPKRGDVLFITSSKKDAGIFWRMQLENMFPGLVIHGVAPNNEGSFVPEEWFVKQKQRWNRIILWYNNDWSKSDNPGVTNAAKYAEKYGIEHYYNPDKTPKDPSDFSKEYGLLDFKLLVQDRVFKKNSKEYQPNTMTRYS